MDPKIVDPEKLFPSELESIGEVERGLRPSRKSCLTRGELIDFVTDHQANREESAARKFSVVGYLQNCFPVDVVVPVRVYVRLQILWWDQTHFMSMAAKQLFPGSEILHTIR
jgi:hypothetical protein